VQVYPLGRVHAGLRDELLDPVEPFVQRPGPLVVVIHIRHSLSVAGLTGLSGECGAESRVAAPDAMQAGDRVRLPGRDRDSGSGGRVQTG
jgi:hypothetical protein